MTNNIEITDAMRESCEIDGDSSHKIYTFRGINGKYIRIYDESGNPDSQTVTIEISRDGYGYTVGRVPVVLTMATADFDLMCEQLHQHKIEQRD